MQERGKRGGVCFLGWGAKFAYANLTPELTFAHATPVYLEEGEAEHGAPDDREQRPVCPHLGLVVAVQCQDAQT